MADIPNPIQGNRLVKDKTFATRLLSYFKDKRGACASSSDEISSFINYAEELLRYQVLTATSDEEISYLRRCGVYEKYNRQYPMTEDGVLIYASMTLYSCMKVGRVGEELLTVRYTQDYKLKSNRVYFTDKTLCTKYMADSEKAISLLDLKKLGLMEKYLEQVRLLE